jgi:hypothetical protein
VAAGVPSATGAGLTAVDSGLYHLAVGNEAASNARAVSYFYSGDSTRSYGLALG